MKKTTRFAAVLLLTLMAAGCQTIQVPTPDQDLVPLQDAPSLLIHARDQRTSDKIGSIGGTFMKLPADQSARLAESNLKKFLYDQKVNGVKTAGTVDFKDKAVLVAAINNAQAQGAVLLDVLGVHVSSVDIILDEPDYQAQLLAVFYDAAGDVVFNMPIDASTQGRSWTVKGEGETISTLYQQGLLQALMHPKFSDYLKSVKARPS